MTQRDQPHCGQTDATVNIPQRQHCDNASDTSLIENNRVAPEWGCNPFLSDSTVFLKKCVTSIIAVLTRCYRAKITVTF